MSKKFVFLSLTFVLLLAACSPNTPTQVAESEKPAVTSIPASPQPEVKVALQAGCTVIGRSPTPDPTQEALIPPVNEKDWIKGDPGAYVTLVEYGDFQ